LAAVGKSDGDHAAHALVVDIRIARVVDAITAGLHGAEQSFGMLEVFGIGHRPSKIEKC
jgi:hypothetical protein